MEYQAAVTEARKLVKRSEEDQYRLAELTWEQVEAGASRRQWSRDTGISPAWVGVLYRVWDEWKGVQALTRPPFSEAYSAVLNPGREAEGGQEVGRAKSTIRSLPPEQKAEVVREALTEPEVAEQVIADPHTDATITRARMRRDDQRETDVRDRAHREAAGLVHHSRIYGGLVDMDAAERRLADALAQFQEIDLDDGDRAKITERVDAVRRMLDAIAAHVTSGQRFDVELAQLLDGGK